MARGELSKKEDRISNDNTENLIEKANMKPHCMKVRFLDEESITERFVSTDEVDHAATKVKKIHILKNRSSSETSILLRNPSLTKQRICERRASVDSQIKKGDSLNNNSLKQNLNGVIKEEEEDNNTDSKSDENTKENEINHQSYKKNCNVYSVNQAKTIASERKKSLPLSSIPKLIGHRADSLKQAALAAEVDCLEGSAVSKDFTARTIGKLSRGLGKLLRRSNSVKISEPDPVYKVAYLGNVLTGWARGESCIEKPLATLWRNYNQSSKPDVVMKLSITNSGLKGFTKEHGLTEYWSHRITYCASPPHYPRIFCWVYRHEGRKLKHELRCHAVLCTKENVSKKITEELQVKLKQALAEFKKDRISKQNARLSLANSVYENPSMPRRKILLSIGAHNYRPPLERSKSAPKLGAIEELCSEEDEEEEEMKSQNNFYNTWTRKSTSDADSVNSEVFSSFSLGRRRSDRLRSPRKVQLKEQVESTDPSSDSDLSFSDEVFSLIVKDKKLNEEDKTEESSHTDVVHPSRLDQFSNLECIYETNEISDAQPLVPDHKVLLQNFSVTDSDDGSVSSGCETASTVTSSDVEPSSLPPQFPTEEFPQIKECDEDEHVSVFQRIQSFERASAKGSNDSINSTERRDSQEVNSIPIGEKNSFKRRSTYPPLKNDPDVLKGYDNKFDTLLDNLTDYDSITSNDDVFKCVGDNDSACSDESGYSEFLEKESQIGSTIMV